MSDVIDIGFAEALRGRGQRVTSQRVVLLRVLRELNRHVTAEEVLRAAAPSLPGLSLPTVYATLELFEELGLVRRLNLADGATRFDPRTDHHHHAVCRRCGAVQDVDAPTDVSAAMRRARRAGFAAERAEVVVTGLCAECA